MDQRIARAVERQKAKISAMPAQRRARRTGARKTHSIDSELFYNAVAVGRQKHGVNNVFDEPEFMRDCERYHPWIKPEQITGDRVSMARTAGGSMRNRFGRVNERIYFRDGKKVVQRQAGDQ